MSRHHILVVDDESFYIGLLIELLSPSYQVTVAKNADKAFAQLQSSELPDLILLDVIMPGIDGYTACELIKSDPRTHNIPIIFLTAKDEEQDELHGLNLGACDYITKPISPPIVKARVATHLALMTSRKSLEDQNRRLESIINERTEEISRIQDVAIYCMASLAETRDSETGKHIRRTQFYVRELAKKLHDTPDFDEPISEQFIDLLFKSAPLHDIGKIGVPDAILLKPEKLDPTEWCEMKRHAIYGREAINSAEQEYGESPFLHIAKDITYSHHEHWDGNGYPQGLKGKSIPLAARIMAIADCYDALISQRPYKKAFTHEQACTIIFEGKGSHFDPQLVEAFEQLQDKFHEIAQNFIDAPTESPIKQ